MKTILENDSEYVCDIKAPCFAVLTPEEINLVQASKTQVLFRKGDNLTKQGAFASYILFLIDGLAKQFIEGEASKDFILRIIKPGEFVGLSTVFLKNTYSYSSIALKDCRAFLVENNTIAKVIRQNGDFGFNIIRRYFEQNTNLFETLNRLINKQMNGRMAHVLLYLNRLKESFPEIFQLLSRKDIADFCGISTESAVKLLKAFEKDGLIKLEDKDIIILNHQAIEEIKKLG